MFTSPYFDIFRFFPPLNCRSSKIEIFKKYYFNSKNLSPQQIWFDLMAFFIEKDPLIPAASFAGRVLDYYFEVKFLKEMTQPTYLLFINFTCVDVQNSFNLSMHFLGET